jgi:uncharacterized membrane protein (DUF485 family)
MRRQASLGLKVTAVFLVILLGLPLLNAYAPALMATRIGGFPLTWLVLAILFYPVTWALAWFFVKRTEELEHEQAAEGRERGILK